MYLGRNAYVILVGKLLERSHFENWGDERIILIFKECIQLCVSTIYEFLFFLSNIITHQITHNPLCTTEFVGRTASLHVSAHRAIIRRYINKPYTIELRLLYGSIYCAYRHVLLIKWKIPCASLTFTNHLFMHRLSGCVSALNLEWLKNVLNKYLKRIKNLKLLNNILKS
jgi:hypothetical protein